MLQKITLIFSFILIISQSNAQEILTLQKCLDSSAVHYPTFKQAKLVDQELELRIQTLKNQSLPQMDLNGKATYQSDVTALPIKLPGIVVPELNKDQYKLTLDATQTIYKGGLSKKQIELEEINSQINKTQSFVELYALKQRVSGLYFQLVLLQKQIEIIENTKKTLEAKRKEIESGVKNGVVLPSVKEKIQVEILKLNQQKIEIVNEKQKAINNLSFLTGFSVTENAIFLLPENNIVQNQKVDRLEIQLLDLQQQKLLQVKNISKSRNLPIFYAFGTVGYGRPGFNMLSNEFQTFGLVGVGMNYKLWNWNEYQRDRKILDLNTQSIQIKKEVFDLETQMAIDQQFEEIKKMEQLAATDNEIMELQTTIVESSYAQMMNGIATSSQYIEDLNRLNQVNLERELHKIKKSIAEISYLWIIGKL